ncbi:hypothetical protein ACCO45_003828 [Purpureocillium lilacinum]|uniref:Uncharacterized protein n=1 Tax=Purpureocillium lilacinum TaxID=33203 RepID=A0ACC4E0Z5_PURLI
MVADSTARRVCTQRGEPGHHGSGYQGHQRNRPRHGEEVVVAAGRPELRLQDQQHHPQHRNRLLGHGPRLESTGRPRAQGFAHGLQAHLQRVPPTRILVQDVARVMQEATQSAGVRPYGVSMLIAGWDEGIEPEEEETTAEGEKKPSKKTGGIHKGGPMLYQVDPTGSYFPWKATAIGKSATKAKTFLEKRYSEELELEDAIHIALLTLKDNIEGEMNGDSIEIGIVGPPAEHLLGMEGVEGLSGPRFRKLTPRRLRTT